MDEMMTGFAPLREIVETEPSDLDYREAALNAAVQMMTTTGQSWVQPTTESVLHAARLFELYLRDG